MASLRRPVTFLLACILLGVLAGCGGPELYPLTITTQAGETVDVQVEIADESEERAQGLMHRESLGESRGMLFVYPDERPLAFWMRDTTIPLSIAYIDGDGTIIGIHDLKPLDETPVRSTVPARYALEVNRGFFAEHGVAAGDQVILPAAP